VDFIDLGLVAGRGRDWCLILLYNHGHQSRQEIEFEGPNRSWAAEPQPGQSPELLRHVMLARGFVGYAPGIQGRVCLFYATPLASELSWLKVARRGLCGVGKGESQAACIEPWPKGLEPSPPCEGEARVGARSSVPVPCGP
jgi:hypothetical protein